MSPMLTALAKQAYLDRPQAISRKPRAPLLSVTDCWRGGSIMEGRRSNLRADLLCFVGGKLRQRLFLYANSSSHDDGRCWSISPQVETTSA